MRTRFTILPRGLLCALLGCTTDLLAGGISGVVTGPDGVTPVPDVVVYATSSPFNGNSGSAVTGADGSYEISGLGAANYSVYFAPPSPSPFLPEYFDGVPDFASLTLVPVTPSDITPGINASLVLGATISGTVDRVTLGVPASGATVEILEALGPGQWFPAAGTTTGGDGTYTVVGLRPGSYRVRFLADDLAVEFYNGALTVGTAADVVVAGGAQITGIDAVLEPAATISGVVTDPDGAPVSAAYIEAFALVAGDWVLVATANSEADGSYVISNLAGGSYRLQFSGPYESVLLSEWYDDAPDLVSADTLVLVTGGVLSGVNASLALGGSISGVVTESAGGASVSFAYVTARDGSGLLVSSAFTSFDGTYSLLRIPTGNYLVTFSHPSYATEHYNDEIFASAADVVAVSVGFNTPGIDAVLGPAANIYGKVTGADGITPLFGIGVEALLFNGSAWEVVGASQSSYLDGTYHLGELPPGNFVVRFSAFGFNTQYFNGAPNAVAATPVVLSESGVATDIDASLSSAGANWVVVERLSATGAGAFALEFAGQPNGWFQLQMSGSLLSWTNIGVPVQAVPMSGDVGTNRISISTSASKEFWRLIEAAP